MKLVKPNIVAQALGITTNALRKRRIRGTKSSNSDPVDAFRYNVSSTGFVSYYLEDLPPSVRENVESITTQRTKRDHDWLMKNDFKYSRTIGRNNDRKKRIKQEEIDRRAKKLLEEEQLRQLKRRENIDPIRTEKNYVYWCDPNSMGNHWNSIKEYEDSKKKKSTSPYY